MRFTSGSISPAPGVQDRTAGSVTVGLTPDEGDDPVRGVVEARGVLEPGDPVGRTVVGCELGAGLLEGF
jgi:hypothetical protein